MKPALGLLARIYQSLSELITFRANQARLRFAETDSSVSETADQALLRRRIRAAATVLLLAKGAFTIRSLILHGSAVPLDGVILTALLVASAWLYSPRTTSYFWLRSVETGIFLGMSLQLGVQLYNQLNQLTMLTPQSAEDITFTAVSFVAAVKDQIIATFGLMMIYGMFIPNTPGRAAVMVFLMAVTPGFVIGMNESSMRAVRDFRQSHVTASGVFSGNLLALAVGAGCAIYGTAIMNRWRNRALKAEQLGQYRLREKIGSGGMGDVYLAEHRLLKRLCAVKVIRADMSENPVMLSRFEREVQATATLTHWNTVQVFDYGQTAEGTFFYVMEHLHGCNLSQVVRKHGPMPEERVIFILRQVCSALREAAAHGLVHRDIKPSNIFLAHVGERFDVVKLLDFGLVRPLNSDNRPELANSDQLQGSPRYMCPEQAKGQSPDSRGDLYSLGATACYLFAGRPPFDLQNVPQLVIAHATQPPPSFDDIGVEASAELEAIVLKCLQKDPNDRFSDPDEMLKALEDLPNARSWTWAKAEEWWQQRPLQTGTNDQASKLITVASDESMTEDDPAISGTPHDALEETVIEMPSDPE